MISIEKGLVIREPWISLILSGRKTWEMRSSRPKYRGWIGLIRKGSGRVSGIARLVDVGELLSDDELHSSIDRHCIPEEMMLSGEIGKWTIQWGDHFVLVRPGGECGDPEPDRGRRTGNATRHRKPGISPAIKNSTGSQGR